MPRYAPNKMPAGVKRQYFELLRTGISGSVAAQAVGVSLSCGSLWFIDAGSVRFVDTPISPRYLTQEGLQPSPAAVSCSSIRDEYGGIEYGGLPVTAKYTALQSNTAPDNVRSRWFSWHASR
jgi:hypothetical protein